MRAFAIVSALLLSALVLALAAPPAAAFCPAPPSGNGVTTCWGSDPMEQPSTTEGPVCFNTLCPGTEPGSSRAFCANVWGGGVPLFYPALCVPTIIDPTLE